MPFLLKTNKIEIEVNMVPIKPKSIAQHGKVVQALEIDGQLVKLIDKWESVGAGTRHYFLPDCLTEVTSRVAEFIPCEEDLNTGKMRKMSVVRSNTIDAKMERPWSVLAKQMVPKVHHWCDVA
jgi:hypothetical protein